MYHLGYSSLGGGGGGDVKHRGCGVCCSPAGGFSPNCSVLGCPACVQPTGTTAVGHAGFQQLEGRDRVVSRRLNCGRAGIRVRTNNQQNLGDAPEFNPFRTCGIHIVDIRLWSRAAAGMCMDGSGRRGMGEAWWSGRERAVHLPLQRSSPNGRNPPLACFPLASIYCIEPTGTTILFIPD